MSDIKQQLKMAQHGYEAAISAIQYMPDEAKPYTRQTAENYLSEIEYLKSIDNHPTN